MKKSGFLKLNWADLLKAFVVGLLAFTFNFLQETFIPALDISPELKMMALAFLGYITKNFFEGVKNED